MQTTVFGDWTRVTMSISHEDNFYTTTAFKYNKNLLSHIGQY